MPETWGDAEWNNLLLSIKLKQCTPFIGSGASYPILPTGKALANEWADEYHYPFADRDNLLKVAQFVAVDQGGLVPKHKVVNRLSGLGPPNFAEEDEPHRVIAELGLPLYITTNYDDFMLRALQYVLPADAVVRRERCPWYLVSGSKLLKVRVPTGTEESPLVYHLHGTLNVPESIVITEDDYLDFLMHISEIRGLIPAQVEDVFRTHSLLFLGYSLDDPDFKLILRRLASYLHRTEGSRHVAVQLAPKANGEPPTDEELALANRQQTYLEQHYGLQKVKVTWKSCRDFARELRERWEAYPK